MNDPLKDQEKWAAGMGLFSVITAEILVSTGIGIGAGYLLWKKAGFPIWTMAVLSLVGLCFAFYRIYLISKKDW
jgi:F0F1-type ATP synthase assembly protein I